MKRALLFLALAFPLAAQTVTTVVTLTWNYDYSSEIMCNEVYATLCDDHMEYGTISGSVFTAISGLGLPSSSAAIYQVVSINVDPVNTGIVFDVNSTTTGPLLSCPSLGCTLTIAGASGCTALNGTYTFAGVAIPPSPPLVPQFITLPVDTSGCTGGSAYNANSATLAIQYSVIFNTTLSGSQTFGVRMCGRDGAGNPSCSSPTSVSVTLPTPPTPSAFTSGSPASLAGSHVP